MSFQKQLNIFGEEMVRDLTREQVQTIERFCKSYPSARWKLDHGRSLWVLYQYKAPSELVRGEYGHNIELAGLRAVIIESGELCLAFQGGYMIWVIKDKISFGYEPNNPLQRKEKGGEKR